MSKKPKRCIFCKDPKRLYGLVHNESEWGYILCESCLHALGALAEIDPDLTMYNFERITKSGKPRDFKDAVKSVERQLKGSR